MVAIIANVALGLEQRLAGVLGGRGLLGSVAQGLGAKLVNANAATGNLIVQKRDEFLIGCGPDIAALRVYNSQGLLNDDNGVSFDEEPTPSWDDTPGGLRCLTPDPRGGIKTPHGAETNPPAGGDDTPGGLRCLTPDPNGAIKPPGGAQPDPLPRGPFRFSNAQDFLALLDAYREGLIPRERFGLRNLLGLFGDQGGQEDVGVDDVAWCGTTPDKTPDQSGGGGFGGP